MKRLFAALTALVIAVAATPVSAETIHSGKVVTITRTTEAPAECQRIGAQHFEHPMWITVYIDGECKVSVDPPDPQFE